MQARRHVWTLPAVLGLTLILTLILALAGNWLAAYGNRLDELTRRPLLSRWSQTIEDRLSSGEYGSACFLIDQLEAGFPGSGEAAAAHSLYPRAMLGLAEECRAEGDYDDALFQLRQVLDDFPESPEAEQARLLCPTIVLEKGLRCWDEEQHTYAVAAFDQLLVLYSDSPEAARAGELYPGLLLDTALARMNQGEYSRALDYLNQLARTYPASAEAASAEGYRNDVYAIMRDEAISRDLTAVAAMFPSRVVDRLAAIGYSIQDASRNPFGMKDAAGVWDGYTVTLYAPGAFKFGIPSGIIMHEWGHAIDDFYLDAGEKSEYRRLRGIPPDIPWMNYDEYNFDQDAYERSPDEDFAAVFRSLMCGEIWYGHTVYGPIADPAGMELWIVQAVSD